MRRSIGPEPPTRKAITRAAPKRSAKRSSSSAIADAKSVRDAGGGHIKDRASAARSAVAGEVAANTPAMIWAGALAIQILAFSTTERRRKVRQKPRATPRGGRSDRRQPEDGRPMLLELEWE